MTTITHINHSTSEINIITDKAKQHFADPYNYTVEILAQFDQHLYENYITAKDKIILDIGANVGLFALHVLPYVERIVCVEPTPEHMEIQKELLDKYTDTYGQDDLILPYDNIEHEQSALNSYTGKTTFNWCGINTTMNSLQSRGDRSFEVDCITLKDLCEKYSLTKVDLCKVDIEGSEWQAITAETLEPVKHIIDKYFIELHPPTQESQEQMKTVFEAVGYKVEKVYHDSLFCTR